MKKILLADDEVYMRFLITELLNNSGIKYELFEFGNGDEALNTALNVEPDLLILDVNMHGKSGFEISKEYKESGKKGVVLVVSASVTPSKEYEKYKEYVDYYVKKPFDNNSFISIINEIIS